MKEGSCVINGQQCTRCCEAIALPISMATLKTYVGEDPDFIRTHWYEISEEEARGINSRLVDNNPVGVKSYYFKCTLLGDYGCTQYENRPTVCSGYPFYGGHHHRPYQNYPEYHPECTEWKKIPLEDVTQKEMF